MNKVVDMSLWSRAGFGRYYLFNVLSYFGSSLSIVALPFYIYEQTESPLVTSLVAASASLPYLLFGLFAGAFADRGNRKRIMIGCDMICAILLATVPAAALLNGHASPWHLIAVSFLTATAFVGFDSSSHGALLQLVGREKLVAANSLLISSDTVIRIAGPVIAGFIIAAWGAEWAIAVTAVCYLLSSMLIGMIRQSFQAERRQGDGEADSGLLRRLRADIGEGLSYIWSEPLIRSLTLLGFGNGFVGGAVGGLIVAFGVQALGFADDAPQLGMLFTFGSLGALLASLGLPPLRARFRPGRITIAGLPAGGAALLGFSMSATVTAASLFYLLWSAASTLVIINGITLRQQLTPDHLQGRVHASGRMIAYGGSPFGALLGGLAASGIGVQPTYAVMAFLLIALFAVSLRTPLRSYKMKVEERRQI